MEGKGDRRSEVIPPVPKTSLKDEGTGNDIGSATGDRGSQSDQVGDVDVRVDGRV